MLVLTILFAFSIGTVDALDCASCTNTTSPSDCHNYIQCNQGDRCFTTSIGVGTDTIFSLGCKTESECLGPSSVGVVGRDLTTHCSQCCAVDNCNKNLCEAGTQVTNEVGQCMDDPTYDCKHISSLFNVCADVVHAKTACRKWCGLCDLVDGAWSLWAEWSNCDVTCGDGHMTRTRTCTDPAPAHGGLPCTGNTTEMILCTRSPCPIHGGWSGWNSWSTCSQSCSIGTESRHRTCDNPTPQIGGNHCFGDPVDFRACFLRSCVDGGWSVWSGWSACSNDLRTRTRVCNNPQPSTFGRDCSGNDEESTGCRTVNGGWSVWSGWSSCSRGLKSRTRVCNNPQPSTFGRDCSGTNKDWSKCDHVAFTVTYPNRTIVNGHPIFTNIITNVGGGYNQATGIFTCPIAGLYEIMLHILSVGKNQVYCYIYKNGVITVSAVTSSDNGYDAGSASIVLELSVGDTVSLGGCHNWQYVYTYEGTSFTGILN